MQTNKETIIEVVTGTTIGMVGSWIISYTVVRTLSDPAIIATVTVGTCTIWSLVRGYWIRRKFNARLINRAKES